MAKFKKNDIVEDSHGNEFTVIMVESSTGRIALQDNDHPHREPFNAHERDYRKA